MERSEAMGDPSAPNGEAKPHSAVANATKRCRLERVVGLLLLLWRLWLFDDAACTLRVLAGQT